MYCIVCSFGWGGMRKAVAAIQNQPKEEVKRRTTHTPQKTLQSKVENTFY